MEKRQNMINVGIEKVMNGHIIMDEKGNVWTIGELPDPFNELLSNNKNIEQKERAPIIETAVVETKEEPIKKKIKQTELEQIPPLGKILKKKVGGRCDIYEGPYNAIVKLYKSEGFHTRKQGEELLGRCLEQLRSYMPSSLKTMLIYYLEYIKEKHSVNIIQKTGYTKIWIGEGQWNGKMKNPEEVLGKKIGRTTRDIYEKPLNELMKGRVNTGKFSYIIFLNIMNKYYNFSETEMKAIRFAYITYIKNQGFFIWTDRKFPKNKRNKERVMTISTTRQKEVEK